METRPVVYTAIFGGYDELRPYPATAHCDFICFTDDAALATPGWTVKVVAPRRGHPRMDAKYFKLMPHEVLPDHEVSLWLDASLNPRRSFVADALASLASAPLALFNHPERACIYDEASFCADMPKYRSQRVREQVEAYRRTGYPAGAGLYACGVLARRHHDPTLRAVNEAWWRENLAWTWQDQLSLPVVLRQHGLTPALMPGDLWHNEWFTYAGHRRDD